MRFNSRQETSLLICTVKCSNMSVQTDSPTSTTHMTLRHPVSTNLTRQVVYAKCNIEARSHNDCCRGKVVSTITYYENVSCLSYQAWISHAQHCLALPYSSTLFHKRHNIRKKDTEYKTHILILSTTSGTFIIPRSVQRDIVINAHRSSCKVPVILVRFKWNPDFLDSFSKNPQISDFIKILLVEAELFHVDKQTDRRKDRHDKASRFSQFCERAQKLDPSIRIT
jgi:hypothetical protein